MRNVKQVFAKGIAVMLSAALVATSFAGLEFTVEKASAETTYTDTGLDVFDNISAAEIADVMSPGWNLGNQLEANSATKVGTEWKNYPGETAWGNPTITAGMFKSVKEAGFKSVRIPVSYLDYIGDEASGYKIDEAWMNRIKEVVDLALAEGLYACINMHGDGYNSVANSWLLCNITDETKQTAIKDKYGKVWTQIAQTFADYDEHLIFESMNEEFDGSTYDLSKIKKAWYDNINAYNQIFVDSVRQVSTNNAKRWLLIPGWNTDINATVGNYGFKFPEDTHRDASIEENRIMVSVHYYEPWGFAGGEDGGNTQWGSFTTDAVHTAATVENGMAKAFDKLRDAFTSQGIPVIIGEYGAIDKTEHDPDSNLYRAYFDRKVCENAKRVGAIPIYWDNGYNGKYGFALFNRKTATDTEKAEVTQQGIIDAIMSVYAEKSQESDATAIALDRTEYAANGKNERFQLTATLTPADATAAVTWSSSDDGVAVVSDKGEVVILGTGDCVISATLPNGIAATCAISQPFQSTTTQFFASNTKTWAVSTSAEKMDIYEGRPQSYKATMTMSKEALSNIGALYLKDVDAESGALDISAISYCHINVNSFSINGVSIPLVYNKDVNAINKDIVDMGIINKWFTADQHEMIENIGDPGKDRSFANYEGLELKDEGNTVVIEFETLADPNAAADPTSTPTSTPAANPKASLSPTQPSTGGATQTPAAVQNGDKKTVGKTVYAVDSVKKKTVSVSAPKNKNATSVSIPATVKIAGKNYKVTSIKKNAYKNCKKLKKVVIGKNVKTIGASAFSGCKNLKTITVKSTVLTKVGAKAFQGIHKKATITVPKTKYKKYKKLFKGKGQPKTVKLKKQ